MEQSLNELAQFSSSLIINTKSTLEEKKMTICSAPLLHLTTGSSVLAERRGSTHDHCPSHSHTEPGSACPVLMTRHTRWNSKHPTSSSNCPALPLFKDRVHERTAIHHFTSPLSMGALTNLCRVACPFPSPTSLDNQGQPAEIQLNTLSDFLFTSGLSST